MLSNNSPIGIFDSGVGGLTLLNKLLEVLPNESFEYYADSGNCPYGNKSVDEIFQLTTKITDYLVRKDSKMIIVACNTITTNIIDKLRKRYPIPFIGMEPGTKPAYFHSVNKRIGILATAGTLKGELYQRTLGNYLDKAFFTSQIGAGLVELIEKDRIDDYTMQETLATLLKPMIDNDIDTLVLGCTHYNYLTSVIQAIFPYTIKIIDTNGAVAEQVARVLNTAGPASPDFGRFINIATSGDVELLGRMVRRLGMHRFTVNLSGVVAHDSSFP